MNKKTIITLSIIGAVVIIGGIWYYMKSNSDGSPCQVSMNGCQSGGGGVFVPTPAPCPPNSTYTLAGTMKSGSCVALPQANPA